MYLNILILALAFVLPIITTVKSARWSSTVLGALAGWSIYGIWICARYGPVQTFEVDQTSSVSIQHWLPLLLIAVSWLACFVLLRIAEKWETPINNLAFGLSFWGLTSALIGGALLSELFTGYQYPPKWVDMLTAQQLETVTLSINVVNAFSLLSAIVLGASVLIPVGRGLFTRTHLRDGSKP